MDILNRLNNSQKKLEKLIKVIGLLSIVIIIFELIDLTIVSKLFWQGNGAIITLFKHIWLPALSYILVWLLVAVLSFRKQTSACLVLLLFTVTYYFSAANALLSDKLFSGFIGIIPFIASSIVLITLAYNMIFLVIWLRTASKNYKIVKNYFEQKEENKTSKEFT